MKKVCALVLGSMVAVVALSCFHTEPAHAVAEFKKEFDNKYIKDPPTTPQEEALKKAASEAKCGICHTGPEGKNKKVRNAYGEALGKLIKKADKKDNPKIQKALEDVAKEPSDPANPDSPTFGDKISKGELPSPEPPAEAK